MSFLEAISLGIIQGLTEFIPVSSSGHLVLFHEFFGSSQYDLAIDAILQLATVLAVLVYFRQDLWRIFLSFINLIRGTQKGEQERNLLFAVTAGTLPAIVLGFLLESKMETVFRSPFLVAMSLLAGSALMFFAERFYKNRKNENEISSLDYKKGLKIGVFQALAVVPGMSRSGSTISGGLFSGLSRESSARFSFILSFPIIFGSGLKKLLELSLNGVLVSLSWSFFLSFVISFIVGISAIHFLIKFLKNHSLNVFIFYRIILAVVVLIFFY